MDIEVATVAPLRVVLVNVGAENVQGAKEQGALVADQGAMAGQGAASQGALAPADKEIEGVAYEVIESNDDDNDLPLLRHYESDDDDSEDGFSHSHFQNGCSVNLSQILPQ